jgi:hypothetical protein
MTRSTAAEPPPDTAPLDAIYFDGRSNQRRKVTLDFGSALDIRENDAFLTAWAYGEIRRLDAPEGMLRLRAITAPELARLELRDPASQGEIRERCAALDGAGGYRETSTKSIVIWSLAATASILGLVWFGVPFAADRLAPLVPTSWEKHLGEAADREARAILRGKTCRSPKGAQALDALSSRLQGAAGLYLPATIEVISSKIPNAVALPGGKVYLFSELLAKSESQDEIAGVLAHELGHLQHRDHLRRLIANGGVAYLVGLLFGDVTGAGALVFAGKTLLNAVHSREAESAADAFAAQIMERLGRSPKPMGSLLLRVTGPEKDGAFTILHDHPLSEDRLEQLSRLDKGATGHAVLTDEDWKALKAICE